MKTYISTTHKIFLLLLFAFSFTQATRAQYLKHYDSTYVIYPKELKDTVLMNTDHFYVGAEIGLGFNVGPTATIQQGDRLSTNAAPFDVYDFSPYAPTKLFLGYAYKSHHFEGSLGMLRERLSVSILDGSGNRAVDYHRNQTYASLTFRYFYRFPIRIPRLKMMIGGEIGGAYRADSPMQEKSTTTFRDTGYTLAPSITNVNNFQLVLGISGRMDIKLCKNLSLTLLATVLGSPLRGTEYMFNYTYQGSTNQTAQVYSSILNVNLNAGLKFEFFSHKKKRATYDKYGIQDPFRDK
jgi:hypothetical protein